MSDAPKGFETLAIDELEENAAARGLISKLPFDVEDLGDDHVVWFAGSSVALDSLRVPENTFVLVDGDLDVRGWFDDRPFGADPENVRALVVRGTLRAGSRLLASETYVGKSMKVTDWLIAESDGDYRLTVEGDLDARFVVALGHHVKVGGRVTAQRKIGFLGLPSDVSKFDMKKAFAPALVNEYGGIDIDALAARALAGEDVFAAF